MSDPTDQLHAAALSAASARRLRAALDAASREYLRVFATHREALEAAIRVYVAADPSGTLTVEQLATHWLYHMECQHDVNYDVGHCACGWNGTPQPNVGAAAQEWASHVLDAVRA